MKPFVKIVKGLAGFWAGFLLVLGLGAGQLTEAEIKSCIGYNPANVFITGGTIDGTPVGGSTPAAGAFTTLTASGATTVTTSTSTTAFKVGTTTTNTGMSIGYWGSPGYGGLWASSQGSPSNTNYAVAQGASGDTYVNAATGLAVHLRINNVEVGTVNAAGITTANAFLSTAPVTETTAARTVAATDNYIIANRAGTVTLTFPTASSNIGRAITISTIQAQTVVSASSNVVPLAGGSAATGILAATAGKWATVVCDGTNWVIMASN